jgi:glycosyltransferase involved in cell wall biosynthesis
MVFRKGFLFYLFFNIRLLFYLLLSRLDLLVANDLDTLLPNFFVAGIKRVPLIYDSHEYFTGVPEIQQRPLVKFVWRLLERLMFPRLKHVMTVSDSIAEKYCSVYGKKPVVVMNLARDSAWIKGYTRAELGIPGNHLLVILQGAGINIDRGGEELIEAVSITERVSLIVAGSGDRIDAMKKMTLSLKLPDRVKFIQSLPWNDLMKYTRSSDVGMSLDKNTNLNYSFSLPNKLFDYLSAGIPVIAGEIPGVKKIIAQHGCGIIIPGITPVEISNALKKLRDNNELLRMLKNNSYRASLTLNWKNESEKVAAFYREIIKNIRLGA